MYSAKVTNRFILLYVDKYININRIVIGGDAYIKTGEALESFCFTYTYVVYLYISKSEKKNKMIIIMIITKNVDKLHFERWNRFDYKCK